MGSPLLMIMPPNQTVFQWSTEALKLACFLTASEEYSFFRFHQALLAPDLWEALWQDLAWAAYMWFAFLLVRSTLWLFSGICEDSVSQPKNWDWVNSPSSSYQLTEGQLLSHRGKCNGCGGDCHRFSDWNQPESPFQPFYLSVVTGMDAPHVESQYSVFLAFHLYSST